jgi:hypothetical protein
MVFIKLLYWERDVQAGASDAAANMSHTEFQKFLQEEYLKPDQMYSADESGLIWKGLPARTLVFGREKCAPRHKSSKEHLRVLSCGNTSRDHKLKLTVKEK